MQIRTVVIKFVIFILLFTILFLAVRLGNLLSDSKLTQDIQSIPALFSAGNFIYSVFAAFIIQAQWQKWNNLNDVSRSEVSMLRQLFIVAHHFPVKERNEIRFHIYKYLNMIVTSNNNKDYKTLRYRSRKVDNALVGIEDSMFAVSKKYPDVGPIAFNFLTRAMEYREQKLQYIAQRLPVSLRLYVSFSTFVIIFGSLFLPFNTLIYNYYFSIVVAILAFGLYLIIEDFDDPLRPGIHQLSMDNYKHLMKEVRLKLESYHFNFSNAESKEKATTLHSK